MNLIMYLRGKEIQLGRWISVRLNVGKRGPSLTTRFNWRKK
jgi:hypothetical protein